MVQTTQLWSLRRGKDHVRKHRLREAQPVGTASMVSQPSHEAALESESEHVHPDETDGARAQDHRQAGRH